MQLSQRLLERIGSAAWLGVVIGALTVIDRRLQEHLWSLPAMPTADGTWGRASELGALLLASVEAASEVGLEQAPLLIFLLVAALLILLAVRT